MQKTGELDGAELVSGLMAPSPSAPFVISRIGNDGKRTEHQLRVRVLRASENIACISAAQKFAKANGELGKEYGDVYREAQAHEILTRALCMSQERERSDGTRYYPPVFVTSDQLRDSFTENEIALSLNAYEVVKAQFSCIESWAPEELDLWAARLSDTLLGPFFLSGLDSSHWPAALLSLAQEVRALRESLGRPLPSLRDSSESSLESSESGTGGSTSSPSAVLSGLPGEVPSQTLLSREAARALVKERRDKNES